MAKLYFLESDSGDRIPLTAETVIGRGEQADVMLTETGISRQHARISMSDDDCWIEDLKSSNGTFLNRVRVKTAATLTHGDQIVLGSARFRFTEVETGSPDPDRTTLMRSQFDNTIVTEPVEDLETSDDVPSKEAGPEEDEATPARYFLTHEESGDKFELIETAVVGRLLPEENDVHISINNPGVSMKHARLTPAEHGVLVEDLGSSNGTWINDLRIAQTMLACHGDAIRFHLENYVLQDRDADQAVQPEYDALPSNARPGGTVVMPIKAEVPQLLSTLEQSSTMAMSRQELDQLMAEDALQPLDGLAQTVSAPTFLVLSGPQAGQPFQLETRAEVNYWNIGRDPHTHELDIVLTDPSVSDFHAKIIFRNGRWKMTDHLSTNALYVNGKRHSAVFLHSGDHVRLGRLDALFLLPDDGAPDRFGTRLRGWLLKAIQQIGNSK